MAASKLVKPSFLLVLFLSRHHLYLKYLPLSNFYKTQSNKFTEEDIKILVKQFKMDFPTGKVTKEKSLAIVRKVFPR